MRFAPTTYSTLIFDCDGVVLNSNAVKTRAFYRSTSLYGVEAADSMVKYHVDNGGVSRYQKFAYFLNNIAPLHGTQRPKDINSLLQAFSGHVRDELLLCEMAPELQLLRQQTSNARWMIVSGGDQNELRDVFDHRGVAELFDGGIFGSPDTKDEILFRELSSSNIEQPALFIGDSKYDYQTASSAGVDFVFLSDWSEVMDWQNWVSVNKISHAKNLTDLFVWRAPFR
jgi:phosphoglycolate phosphatase-like HAD superfamily hydrolase